MRQWQLEAAVEGATSSLFFLSGPERNKETCGQSRIGIRDFDPADGTPTASERASSCDSGRSQGATRGISVFPRRKIGGLAPSKHRAPVTLDYQALEGLFDLPQPDAARELGIALTTLKHACRRLGVSRWPYSRKRMDCSESGAADGAADERHAASQCTALSDQGLSDSSGERRAGGSSGGASGTSSQAGDKESDCTTSFASGDAGLDVLLSDSSEVYDRRHDPESDGPFEADTLIEDGAQCANDLARCPALLHPAPGVGATGPAAQAAAPRVTERMPGGWAVPCSWWLVPDAGTREAERDSEFWSMLPFEVPWSI